MCFYIHHKHRKPKIAKRDINCYKLGMKIDETSFKSEFQEHLYNFGEKQTELELSPIHDIIMAGYHSYSNKRKLRFGFPYRVKCIIPKGSIYYYNPCMKEYVSSNIIVQEFM